MYVCALVKVREREFVCVRYTYFECVLHVSYMYHICNLCMVCVCVWGGARSWVGSPLIPVQAVCMCVSVVGISCSFMCQSGCVMCLCPCLRDVSLCV